MIRSGVASGQPNRYVIISALGVTQILAWGSSYYLLAVLAHPIANETGWPLSVIVGGLSLGLLVSAVVSPWVGRTIEARGGRPILILSALLLAGGLAMAGFATHIAVYLLAWTIVGAGMGAGLYDPAFSTLGRLYGHEARSAITALTLFGGFASTVCWPLSAYLTSHLGWRDACLVYAAIHLFIVLPIYIVALPRDRGSASATHAKTETQEDQGDGRQVPRASFALLAVVIALGSAISATLSVHLLTLLEAKGFALAVAVSLGALVGPAQVGARLIEMIAGRRHHPIWTKVASSALVAIGLVALWSDEFAVSVALISYGAGIGLDSIARGTLPLALFGPRRYPSLMGQLAVGTLIAQAATPILGAWLIEQIGPRATLGILVAVAAANVAGVGMLYGLVRSETVKQQRA